MCGNGIPLYMAAPAATRGHCDLAPAGSRGKSGLPAPALRPGSGWGRPKDDQRLLRQHRSRFTQRDLDIGMLGDLGTDRSGQKTLVFC